MREPAFIKQNKAKWQRFEALLGGKAEVKPDEMAELFVQVTDDLSYAKTFYPKSEVAAYLNGLAAKVHQGIYKNRREESSRILNFWKYELPYLFKQSHRQLLLAFVIFAAAVGVGALSAANDDTFVRLILGDYYVNMTESNIENDDPMAVYKDSMQAEMFLGITINNIRVSFICFIFGLLASYGTAYVLFSNGIMLGAFQYFFYQKGLFLTSFLTIWIHGTLEISAIVIAGCAGFVMGNSLLFPGTYSRLESFKRGVKQGTKIIIGLVPIFIAAGFLEGYVTRHTEMPAIFKVAIIGGSAAFIVWYFIVYPMRLNQSGIPASVARQLNLLPDEGESWGMPPEQNNLTQTANQH